jgi:Icc-related predicted phosphoesterase
MKIVSISDVHGKWNKITIPQCDLLISAGDYSFRGEQHMVRDFHSWLDKQPATHIISVQGNHEEWVEKNFLLAKDIAQKACPRVHFMDEGLVEIDGIKIWCSAITPWFYSWAWNRRRTIEEVNAFGGPWIKDHWDKIPLDTDILVTHGPPYGILDEVLLPNGDSYDPPRNVGCEELLLKIKQLPNLQLHVFGHIHSSSGTKMVCGIPFINAAICDEMYAPTNPVRIFEL